MPEKSSAKKKSRLAFPLGLLIIILAVFGTVHVAGLIKGAVASRLDNSAERARYSEFLEPVVMFDPDPFDDISTADISQLVNASVWSIVMNSDSTQGYSYSTGSEVGVLIPQDDVINEFERLFGKEVELSGMLASLDMTEFDITYDSAQGGFIIPITANETAYFPNVTKLETRGDSVILTVELIGSKAWADVVKNNYEAPQADKVLTVTLRDNGGKKYVASLQNAGGSGTAELSAPPPTAPVLEFTTAEQTTSGEGESESVTGETTTAAPESTTE